MNHDDLEFRICQYLDGTLPVESAVALFDELAKNPQSMQLLDEYRRLELLLSNMSAVPPIDEDALADRISGAIDEDAATRMNLNFASRLARSWRVAVAASVLIGLGVGGYLLKKADRPDVPSNVIAQIQGPSAEPALAAAVARIEIGPGTMASAEADAYQYADLMSRPGRVVIAKGDDAPGILNPPQ